jgi:DNA-directed RNA polymerase specialized sigma24 family protein
MSYTTEDIITLAGILAARYRNQQEYEDLKQEGIIAGLEAMEAQVGWSLTVAHMRKAMSGYMNIHLKPVYIPRSGAVYSLVSALKKHGGGDIMDSTEASLVAALTGAVEEVDEFAIGYNRDEETPEEHYERIEWGRYIRDSFWRYLEPHEAVTLDMIYFEDYPVVDIAYGMGTDIYTIYRYRDTGMKKLSKIITTQMGD